MNPISIQLWSLNENTSKDFAGTMTEVAKIGYKAVELAGTGNLKPAEAAKAIEGAGLQVSGMHIDWKSLTEKFDEVLENVRRFKTKEVIVPYMPRETFATKESSITYGEKLGALGAKFRAEGLTLSYHNHDGEFVLHDGRPALEWMLDACTPQDVGAQIDLYWVGAAGLEPLRMLHRLGARARLLHLKDGIGLERTDLGQGSIDFPAIFKLADENDLVDWYTVEQEEFKVSPLESIRVAFDYLRGLGRA